MKTTKVRSLTGAAALLLAATAGPPAAQAKPELAERIGEWGGTWPRVDVRDEIRIDAVTPEGVRGTFCGVRTGDGSVYFFDFEKVESQAKPDRLRMKRRKQTYWLWATGKGVSLGYQRTGQKRHRMRLRQGKMSCIGRITRAGEPIEAQAEAADGEGLVGRWWARHDGVANHRDLDEDRAGGRSERNDVPGAQGPVHRVRGLRPRRPHRGEGRRRRSDHRAQAVQKEGHPRDEDGRGRTAHVQRERGQEAWCGHWNSTEELPRTGAWAGYGRHR